MSTEKNLQLEKNDSDLCLHLTGEWEQLAAIPDLPDVDLDGITSLSFDTTKLGAWNSCLPVFLVKVAAYCETHHLIPNYSSLPEGVIGLYRLATTVEERQGARRTQIKSGWVNRLGQTTIKHLDAVKGIVTFVGEFAMAFGRMCLGRATFRRVDFLEALSESGPQALGIVTLISVLVGTILAFLGAVQLKMFGAEIYIADLVGIGMMREMGALMTAIIMTGRTGAAFAARLGTMQVNEEIDALKTLAFNPMEFLVLPRVLAMCIMIPLLTIYANILGILGGAAVGVGMLNLTPVQYYIETQSSMGLASMAAGLIKSIVFGIIVAMTGCMNGIRCGRSALAVGEATTNAVVSGIVAVIVADSLLNILYIVTGF